MNGERITLSPDSETNVAECSVGIMAYNEEANIANVLSSILNQKMTGKKIREIIVVASGCHDRTVAIVVSIASREPRVRLIEQARREGKASAINLFIGAARARLAGRRCRRRRGRTDGTAAEGALDRDVGTAGRPRRRRMAATGPDRGGGRRPGRGDGSRGRARGLPASPSDAVAERLDRGRAARRRRGRHRRRTTIGRWRARGAGHLAGLVAGRRPARVLVGSRGRSRVRPAGVCLAARDPGRAERLDRAPDDRRPAQGVGAEWPDPVGG